MKIEKLEFKCSNCGKTLKINVDEEDYQYYLKHNYFQEYSEAYQDFFNGHGWVLKQAIFCSTCKYEHSECYQD